MVNFIFSIIIPHYNIPDLLLRCLKSIPVREDIQVIVVDDCSPDADTYREKYPELSRPYLELYSTPQGGSAGRARNVGLQHAKGKWVLFADADDFFADGFIHIIDECADKEDDVIYFPIKSVHSDNIDISSERSSWCNEQIAQYMEDKDETFLRRNHYAPWAMMIRREHIVNNRLLFDEGKYSNDYYFTCTCGCLARKISVVDKVVYVLTERKDSLCHDYMKKPGELECRSNVIIRIQKFLNSMGYPMDESKIMYYLKLNIMALNFRFLKTLHDELGYSYIGLIIRSIKIIIQIAINFLYFQKTKITI